MGDPKGRGVPSYLLLATLSTLFCCPPFGAAAMVAGTRVRERLQAGDEAGARKASAGARRHLWLSALVGIPMHLIFLAVLLGVVWFVWAHPEEVAAWLDGRVSHRPGACGMMLALAMGSLGGLGASPTRWGWKERLPSAILLAGSGLFLGLLAALDPSGVGIFPRCPWPELTGWQCAGCGTLRGWHHLLNGRPLSAWGMNPLTTVVLPTAVLGSFLIGSRRPGRVGIGRLSTKEATTLLLTVAAFVLLRNLPIRSCWDVAP